MLELICKTCSKKEYEPNIYVSSLYQFYMLQEAGFPFEADTLSLSTWYDLGVLRHKIEAKRHSPLDPDSGKRKRLKHGRK